MSEPGVAVTTPALAEPCTEAQRVDDSIVEVRKRHGYIYGLFASDAPLMLWECRYIGKTVTSLEKRLRDHIGEATRQRDGVYTEDCYRAKWIRSVLNRGAQLVILQFESHYGDDIFLEILGLRERSWIASGRHQGWRLTNGTDGGDGSLGFRHTPESLEKIRKTLQLPETREKMTQAQLGNTKGRGNKGKVRSSKTRERISSTRIERQIRHTPESRAKMRGPRGPRTAEQRANMSAAQRLVSKPLLQCECGMSCPNIAMLSHLKSSGHALLNFNVPYPV